MRCPASSCIGTCPQWSELAPCCKRQEPGCDDALLPLEPGFNSLVASSIELGKLLAEKGKITLRASGTCMYPCIRPGDVLHIKPGPVDQMAVGAIGVYRRTNCLFGHRIIGRGIDNGRPYIITRPDRAKFGDDGPIYEEDVLGVVSGIDRRGKTFSPRKRRSAWPKQLYFTSCFKFYEVREALRHKVIACLTFCQRTHIYQRSAQRWFTKRNPILTYSLRVPVGARLAPGLYREITPKELGSLMLNGNEAGPVRWTLALMLKKDRWPAASVTFVRRPPECPFAGWWVSHLQVRIRYRGAGLEEKIFQQAEEIFAQGGVSELWVNSVREMPATGPVFIDLGFREASPWLPKNIDGQKAAPQGLRLLRREVPR